jgi:peroxiredoxin
MRPVALDHRGGKGWMVVHRCDRCGTVRPNRIAAGVMQPDDLGAVASLSGRRAPSAEAGQNGGMAVNSFMVDIGTPAPDFRLPRADGDGEVALKDVESAPALLVAFLSNHCPYVKHVEAAFGAFATEYAARGLATVAICANDVVNYPDDAAAHLVDQAERAGFTFPYLVDEDQQVARAYRAACTPDFFLYDGQRRLAYRGQFDGSRPTSGQAATGASLRSAADRVLAGEPVPEPHEASMGCSIKWKPGNDPAA